MEVGSLYFLAFGDVAPLGRAGGVRKGIVDFFMNPSDRAELRNPVSTDSVSLTLKVASAAKVLDGVAQDLSGDQSFVSSTEPGQGLC